MAHPIAGGLSGTVAVSEPRAFAAARPGPGATIVATRRFESGRAAIYVYGAGDATLTGPAPAPSVVFFFTYRGPSGAYAEGWELFDNSIDYLLGSI